MRRIFYYLLLTLSIFTLQTQQKKASSSSSATTVNLTAKASTAAWNSSEVQNCLSCWGKRGSSAIYCNENNVNGYCCNGQNSTFCKESNSTRCSNSLTYSNNKYAFCLPPNELICGNTKQYTLKSTNATNVTISKLSSAQKNGSVCQILLETVEGDIFSVSAKLQLVFTNITDVIVYVSQGANLKAANQSINGAIQSTYNLPVSNGTYILVVPTAQTLTGTVKFSFRLTENSTGSSNHTSIGGWYTGPKKTIAIIVTVILGVVIIALIIIAIVCIVKCIKKRNQNRIGQDGDIATNDEKETNRNMQETYDTNKTKGDFFSSRGNNSTKKGPSQYGMGGDYDDGYH